MLDDFTDGGFLCIINIQDWTRKDFWVLIPILCMGAKGARFLPGEGRQDKIKTERTDCTPCFENCLRVRASQWEAM
ncbi:hypothetical protein NIES3974_25100 [Calothrix sp. NIES-3974]|nr:hypothetical protein NIES3974_25100 [Calothrix sp. NIES-3974]